MLRRWTISWPFLFFGTLSAVWSDPMTPSNSQPENSYWQRSDSTKVEGENHLTQNLLTTLLCLKLRSFHMIITESGNFGCSLAESGLLLCSGHFSWSLRHPHAYLSPEISQLVRTFPSPWEVWFPFLCFEEMWKYISQTNWLHTARKKWQNDFVCESDTYAFCHASYVSKIISGLKEGAFPATVAVCLFFLRTS